MSFLPRKWNTPTMIGIACLAIAVVAIACYLLYKKYHSSDEESEDNIKQHDAVKTNPNGENHDSGGAPPNTKPTLVLFWSKNCGHCVAMHPEWMKVKDILNQKGSQVVAIDFEASVEPDVFKEGQKYLQDFGGVPDIRLFPQGFGFNLPSIKYKSGDRSEKAILKFAYTG